jgi:isoleucyl-tRNA synthetase
MAQELKDTLRLPRTDFPMRAALPQREPGRLAHWDRIRLYQAIQERRAEAPTFVLHDGPPFTNGNVHIGTALNKSLKEFTLRYKSMRGFRTPYVPGWDCHGLPIEQKVSREVQEQNLNLSTAELRARCDAFSESWISRQTAQFRRLGVLGDWEHPYRTKDPAFEADIVRNFSAFVEKGLVYRSKKPVYWSIPFETALAEAEIEYKEHVSPSIWVKFPVPVEEARRLGLPSEKPVFVVIWTTTPWTLPANLAIAVHPAVEYAVADFGAEFLLVARPLLPDVIESAKRSKTLSEDAVVPDPNVIVTGEALSGLKARHPFIDRESPVVTAEYVTTESGTGCVHTAPGHGAEDYQTGLKYGLEIYCPVGNDGRFVDDGRVPKELVGVSALESVEDLEKKRTSAANVGVLKLLASTGTLLAKQKLTHSYPHCWRSKTPIIFRAVDQWFVSLGDTAPSPRSEALAAVGKVSWIPAWGEARIRGAVESRPDWCVSRQRSWGVPIPAFYDGDRKAYLDNGVARAIADLFEKKGSNIWYDSTAQELLAGVSLPTDWPSAESLTPGRDTLDVWFDSGSTHTAVLKRGMGGTSWPADLYLEGSDQHRGWFQSSLWTGVIASGGAPYRSVLTHGFIVDSDRKKISKSSSYEKPQTSDAYVGEYGADILRLWIASQDFRDDIPISKEILSHVSEAYRQIRNTLRYQISVLHDFDPAAHVVPVDRMDALDRWALHQAAALLRSATAAYDSCEFHRVYQLCNQFCSVTLSATYHDIVKDRLYTLAPDSPLRRSTQTAIHSIFGVLVKVLAPILAFTSDEAWAYATQRTEYSDDPVHLQDWPEPHAEWNSEAIAGDFESLLAVRTQVNEAIEPLRAAGKLGKSLDAAVSLTAKAPLQPVLEKHRDLLPELFIVSDVSLAAGDAPDRPQVAIQPCSEKGLIRCPRCWRWVPTLAPSASGEVCPRCVEALFPSA